MQPRISFDLFKTMVAYAATSSVVEAARQLGLTQPAVSSQLQRLEALLGQPLFFAQGRRKSLTPFGRALADAVANPLVAVERAVERVIQQFGDPESLTLRVGCRRELLGRIAPRIDFPGTVVFVPSTNVEVIRHLERLEIDVGISHTRPDSTEFAAKKLFDEGSVLIVREDLLKELGARFERWQDFATPEFLRVLPAVVYKAEAPLLRPLLEKAGVTLVQVRRRMICEDWPTVVRLVEQGRGYSVVPEHFAEGLPRAIRAVRLPSGASTAVTFYAVYPKALVEIPAYRQCLARMT